MERADLEQWKAKEVARLLALVETERRYYQEIVASIPVGLLVLSSDLSIVSANRAVRHIFGLRSGDPLRGRLDALLPAWVLDRVQEVLKTGVIQPGLLVELEKPEKRLLRLAILAVHNWDDEAGAEALVCIEDLSTVERPPQVSLSLTEPAAASKPAAAPTKPASEAQPARASDIVNHLEAVVWELDLSSTTFVFVSPFAEQLLGFPAQHWMEQASFWTDRIHPADRDWVVASYQHAIERGESHVVEFHAVTADGRTVRLRESSHVVADSHGRPDRLVGLSVDVTERRLLDQQLAQAQRVEAVSKLASRLAHDLNNMLMIVTGYSEELFNGLPQHSSLRGDVQEIITATERMTALTTQLLTFARRQSAPAGRVELEMMLGTVQQYLRVLLGDQLQLEVQLSPHPTVVRADGSQLEQIIASLVERLRANIPGKGRIRIETLPLEIKEELRNPDAPLSPGTYSVITITSTGNMLQVESSPSLFETVFPGKEPSDETGAAVTRAYGIVRQWGGDIAVLDGPSRQPGFRVFLARVEEPAESKPEPVAQPVAEAAPVEPAPRLETILVVEDEAGIRALVRKILRRQGYEVLEASNADDALAICREYSAKIDLLVTDVIMPQVGGRELVDRVRQLRPESKVLYVSGYTDDAAIYSGKFPPGTAFLQKPFTLGALLDKVKEVLAS